MCRVSCNCDCDWVGGGRVCLRCCLVGGDGAIRGTLHVAQCAAPRCACVWRAVMRGVGAVCGGGGWWANGSPPSPPSPPHVRSAAGFFRSTLPLLSAVCACCSCLVTAPLPSRTPYIVTDLRTTVHSRGRWSRVSPLLFSFPNIQPTHYPPSTLSQPLFHFRAAASLYVCVCVVGGAPRL